MRVSQGRSYQGQKSCVFVLVDEISVGFGRFEKVCAMQEEEKGGKKTKWGGL